MPWFITSFWQAFGRDSHLPHSLIRPHHSWCSLVQVAQSTHWLDEINCLKLEHQTSGPGHKGKPALLKDAQLSNGLFHIPKVHKSLNSRVAYHPGVLWTIFLLQQHFWWPFMAADTREYVSACSVCTRNKSSLTSCLLAASSSSSSSSLVPRSCEFCH